jgi:hypothetical protein
MSKTPAGSTHSLLRNGIMGWENVGLVAILNKDD